MEFIFVPTVFTAAIFYIQLYICEISPVTQLITYSPQYWTFIVPIIYLCISIKKKSKLGIWVNIFLILFCMSAFLTFNFGENIPKSEDKNELKIVLPECKDNLGEIVTEGFTYKITDMIKCNDNLCAKIPAEEIELDERISLEKWVIKSEDRDIDCYKPVVKIPYYGPKKDMAKLICEYVTKNSKEAIIIGDFGFPQRSINYEVMSKDFKDYNKIKAGFALNKTCFVFVSKEMEAQINGT